MMAPTDTKDGDSATIAALKCAYQLMQQRIISNPNDMMGVILFGTEATKYSDDEESSETSYPNCYLLADLDIPAAEDVKRLRDLIQSEDVSDILTPTDDGTSLGNALFCANQVFTTKAPNFTSRRLFIVTDNDNPHSDDKALRDTAVVRAKDLFDLAVIIELFPIAQQGRGFDRSRFYDVSTAIRLDYRLTLPEYRLSRSNFRPRSTCTSSCDQNPWNW
jgi:ATP-dependent DNA helicase 2 subunit 1